MSTIVLNFIGNDEWFWNSFYMLGFEYKNGK